jgi:small subunit ribosomal protein S18
MKVKKKGQVKGKTKLGLKGKKGPFKGRAGFKKRESGMPMRKKYCRLCIEKAKSLDYKDLRKMEGFINDRGKILSSRMSGACARHQRIIAEAVKKARFVSLLPYTR